MQPIALITGAGNGACTECCGYTECTRDSHGSSDEAAPTLPSRRRAQRPAPRHAKGLQEQIGCRGLKSGSKSRQGSGAQAWQPAHGHGQPHTYKTVVFYF